jgi:UDP-3-O-[3-hydroxymyristoyl] N-acetylglucosamine deacetylase
LSRRFRPACQKTLKTPIGCTGIGLHTGEKISMTLRPAAPGQGIVFKRTDLHGAASVVPATWRHVKDTQFCTALANDEGTRVSTVEHLMAALYGCEIDNALIEIDGPEVPVMDGSSAPFVFLIECAGTVDQAAVRRGIEVLRPITVEDKDCHLSVAPADCLSLDFEIDFGNTAVARQTYQLDVAPAAFRAELARARTFGFLHDIGRLQAAGLARGGSLDNAVIVSGDKVLNNDGLRYDDEFVRHKMLDCVGDLYLAGAPILGAITASRSGHRLNNRLLHALFAEPDSFRYVELTDTGMPLATLPEAEDRLGARFGLGAAD